MWGIFIKMIIIYNRHFPFGDYAAINIFGIIFARSQYGKVTKRLCNHEYIHTLQQRELLFFIFYFLYGIEWLLLCIKHRNSKEAYRNISFEREAYANDNDYAYCSHRPHYSWCRYFNLL